MDFKDCLRNIQSYRKAILFLGAGFSNAAPNRVGLSTPSGNQLSERILAKLKIPGTAPLGLSIDKMREKLPSSEAFDFLCDQLYVRFLAEKQEELLALPWTRIYTTNVDNIGTVHSQRRCLDATESCVDLSFGDFIYLHGCITNCNSNNFGQKLKLGEQMYISNALSSSGYNHDLRKDLFSADVVVVVGYSMADPNYQEIFYNSDDLLSKCFVVSGVPDELAAYRIALIGVNTLMTVSQMMDQHQALPVNTPPMTGSLHHSQVATSFDAKEVTQRSRQELLIYGRYDENVARTSWAADEQLYAIRRNIADQLTVMRSPSIGIVHSHLGNGKSVIISYAKFIMAKSMSDVFYIKAETGVDDLLKILKNVPDNSFVFFEGDVFSVSKAVDIVIEKSLRLCATSRSTTLRAATPLLVKAAKGKNLLRLFDANILSSQELSDFHDLVDSMAFWPADMNSLSKGQRVDLLSSAFNGNINAIILKIFENQKVRTEIFRQWSEAQSTLRQVMDHFIVASYMMMIDIAIPAYLLNEFQRVDFRELKNAESDIIVLDPSGRVRFGNSIIAEFVLSHHENQEQVINAVVRFAKFVSSHVSQRSLQWMVRRILRYWNLSRLLGSPTAPNQVLDKASYIPAVRADPLFWVQYSISQMENKNFLAAVRFLGRAYKEASQKGPTFDPYQIDTHSARLTVRRIKEEGLYEGSGKDLVEGVSKLKAVVQRRSDDVYHVSKVIVLLLSSDLKLAFHLKDFEYTAIKRDLIHIKGIMAASSPSTIFDVERQAVELITKLI